MELVVAGQSASRGRSYESKTDRTLVATFGIVRRQSSGIAATALIRAKAGMLVTFFPVRSLADRAAIESDLATGAWFEEHIMGTAEAALNCWSSFLCIDVDICGDRGVSRLDRGTVRFRFGRRGPERS